MPDLDHKHEIIHLGQETAPEPQAKSFLEKLPFRKEKEKEEDEKKLAKELAEAKPELSPYVVKNAKAAMAAAPLVKSKTYLALEKILSENLESYYQALEPAKQEAFRQKGEETVCKIEAMVITFKAKARKIVLLISQWLKMIPGINKFFLEQEAKIKTYKIIAFALQYKKENKNKW